MLKYLISKGTAGGQLIGALAKFITILYSLHAEIKGLMLCNSLCPVAKALLRDHNASYSYRV